MLIDWYDGPAVTRQICEMKNKPVVSIAGHSLGGGAGRKMAQELAECGVKVKTLVVMDPVGEANVPKSVKVFVFWNPLLHGVMTHDPVIKNTIRNNF